MGHPIKGDEIPLQPQIVLEPFKIWATDFEGPFNPPSNQNTYILVCTDYVTKWVEVVALSRAMEEEVINFYSNCSFDMGYLGSS